jgi:hypothetical protein
MKFDNECYVDDVKDDCSPEFYDKPKLSGFFYTPRSDLIQKYSVKGEDAYGQPIGGPAIVQPFTHDEFEPPARVECPPQPSLFVLQADCCDSHCCRQKCHGSCRSKKSSKQQYVAPQQAQIMYGANDMGDWRSTRKTSKKDRQMNHYVQQSEVQLPSVQPYTDPNGDQYIVDAQQCQTGCGDPIYTKFLPHGMGDYGPPQTVEYVEYHGNGQINGDGNLYSRNFPGQGKPAGGRNYDGNFILKKDGGYGMPGGYGINMGALSIGDRY